MNSLRAQHLFMAWVLLFIPSAVVATTTWDGRHDTSRIDITVVYFVPVDRQPLPDWYERASYYCRRIERFHAREFQAVSVLKTHLAEQPLMSRRTTEQLRQGDANAIFFATLREAEERLQFGHAPREGFPVLLVLSDINWRPLDDFYRVKPTPAGLAFEGNFNGSEHFPGATSGGARATYHADRGLGWGLVSADGWRVPYRGSDCVVYHEGCGHTVGLPHPEPGNGSVMSLGQYRGWLSESWLDREQKMRLGWEPQQQPPSPELRLFSEFRALPEPRIPRPADEVSLSLSWPTGADVASLRVRYQTAIESPWVEVPQAWEGSSPKTVTLGRFDRETPVSYRVDAELEDGSTEELWGYLQVRQSPQQPLLPRQLSGDLFGGSDQAVLPTQVSEGSRDLLAEIDLDKSWQAGEWTRENGVLTSPKRFGAKLELLPPPPTAYRLVAIVEPLDPPNGLILGQRSGLQRFVALFGYAVSGQQLSAIENVDGRNVGNETTFRGEVFRQHQLSEVTVTVKPTGVRMTVDGKSIVNWKGTAKQLSLSDYWQTPDDTALFLGSYDCRYRFHRLSLERIGE